MDQVPSSLSRQGSKTPRGLLVVPVYKPAPEWESFFPALVAAVAASELPLAIRVVGDGNTPAVRQRIDAIVQEARQRWPNLIRPTRHRDSNVGKGAAIYFGWAGADEEWLGFVDCDAAVPPSEVIRLARIALFEASPRTAVVASRNPASGLPQRRSPLRRRLSCVFSWLVRVGTALPVRDTQCGLKWIPQGAFQAVRGHLRESRFVFDVELLARLREQGLAFREIPIEWWEASHTSILLWRDGPAMLWGLLRVSFRLLLFSSVRD